MQLHQPTIPEFHSNSLPMISQWSTNDQPIIYHSYTTHQPLTAHMGARFIPWAVCLSLRRCIRPAGGGHQMAMEPVTKWGHPSTGDQRLRIGTIAWLSYRNMLIKQWIEGNFDRQQMVKIESVKFENMFRQPQYFFLHSGPSNSVACLLETQLFSCFELV